MELPLTIEEGDGEYGSPLDAPSSPMPKRYSSLSLKDVVYLCADRRNDDAWEEFVSRVGKPIELTVMRTLPRSKRSLWLIMELRQETYVKLLKDGCRLLRDCTINHEDQEILGYIKKTARSVTLDHLKRDRRKKAPGDKPHISLSEVDLEAGKQADGTQEKILFAVLEREIDELLKHSLTGPDKERDRIIFSLCIWRKMSCKEIASLRTIGLTAKGVGSVIERLKRCLREQILRSHADSGDDKE